MKHLPVPIDVEGSTLCCQAGDPFYGTTPTVDVDTPSLGGNQLWTGQNVWLSTNGGPGGFAFGVCCSLSITLRITGTLNVLADGEHDISVYLNNVLLWTTAASTALGQAWYMNAHGGSPTTNPFDVYPYYEGIIGGLTPPQYYHEMVIPMDQRACGNIIKLYAGTNSTYPSPTGNASWTVLATAIG